MLTSVDSARVEPFCNYIFKNIKEYPIFTDEFYTENIISISIDSFNFQMKPKRISIQFRQTLNSPSCFCILQVLNYSLSFLAFYC